MQPFQVTSGEIETAINHPSVRAVLPGTHGASTAVLRFRYLGPTDAQVPLKSTGPRQQVGIKMLASDGNNVAYACWRWHPGEPRIQVQVKHQGAYHHPAPTEVYLDRRGRIPDIDQAYQLRVQRDNLVMRVYLDDEPYWVGELPPQADELDPDGLIGLRTDNVRLATLLLTE